MLITYEPAPIVLFTYNRLKHTQQTIESLKKNILARESTLYIFSDGPKTPNDQNVLAVRNYIKSISGFKKVHVILRKTNLGLATSIVSGVTNIVNKYGKIIVLEDDMISSPYFLQFMNNGLYRYENNDKVISINGYQYPVKQKLPEIFFLKSADCWGWATWKRGWALFEPDGKKLFSQIKRNNQEFEFDFDGKYPFSKALKYVHLHNKNMWAIKWYASAFVHNKVSLYPGAALIKNIGLDTSGVHSDGSKDFDGTISNQPITIESVDINENHFAKKIIGDFLYKTHTTPYVRIKQKIKSILRIPYQT